jgi:hypothetical protein
MTTPASKPRWYHLTPARFFIGLLVMQVFLLLSERLQWFAFNEKKGWTVLIAVGVVGVAVVAMLVWALVCLCIRLRFQFGVRSLLLFLVAVSVPLGWFAWEMERARRQREAVEWVERSGGWVFYGEDYSGDAGPFGPPPQSLLQWLLGRNFWYEVDDVYLSTANITNDDLTKLRPLAELRSLDLDANQITDGGLKHVRQLTELRELLLAGADITDEGLTSLQTLTKLQHLGLTGTDVTDHGLEYLRGFKNLQCLQLYGTAVTSDGVTALQEHLPDCQILYGVPPPVQPRF